MLFSVYIKAVLLFFYLQSSEVHGENCTCEYLKQSFMVLVREWDGMRVYSELVHFNISSKCWEENSAPKREGQSFIRYVFCDSRFEVLAAVLLEISRLGCYAVSVGKYLTDVPKDRSSSIFRVKEFQDSRVSSWSVRLFTGPHGLISRRTLCEFIFCICRCLFMHMYLMPCSKATVSLRRWYMYLPPWSVV